MCVCVFCVNTGARYDTELKKHELYVIEPSGVMYRYFGAAVGKGRQVGAAYINGRQNEGMVRTAQIRVNTSGSQFVGKISNRLQIPKTFSRSSLRAVRYIPTTRREEGEVMFERVARTAFGSLVMIPRLALRAAIGGCVG